MGAKLLGSKEWSSSLANKKIRKINHSTDNNISKEKWTKNEVWSSLILLWEILHKSAFPLWDGARPCRLQQGLSIWSPFTRLDEGGL